MEQEKRNIDTPHDYSRWIFAACRDREGREEGMSITRSANYNLKSEFDNRRMKTMRKLIENLLKKSECIVFYSYYVSFYQNLEKGIHKDLWHECVTSQEYRESHPGDRELEKITIKDILLDSEWEAIWEMGERGDVLIERCDVFDTNEKERLVKLYSSIAARKAEQVSEKCSEDIVAELIMEVEDLEKRLSGLKKKIKRLKESKIVQGKEPV